MGILTLKDFIHVFMNANKAVERTKYLLKPSETLSQQVVRGGGWVFALRITEQLFGLARLIILARLLAPADFGLFGIALLAMSALETFSQTGFSVALIQKKEDIKPYLDTAWTVQLIRGTILALILFAVAPYIADFFDAPAAKSILQVIGLSVLFQGFTSVGVIYFQKELEFHKQFAYMFSGTLVNVGVAILAAFLLRSVWALVFGLLAGNIMRMVVSFLIHPYRPHLHFSYKQFKELFGFGKWIFGSSMLVFLITQGDDIFVGKFLGVAALGFYQLAYKISNMPTTEIAHVISQVTFPVYSMLQDNINKLSNAYLKVLQLTTFISMPLAGLIFILAPEFTILFLGEKWMPMVPAMQVLVLAGLVRSVVATTGPIFYAVGKPKVETRWQVVRLTVMAALIYPFTIKWGILGASIVVFLSISISSVGFSYMCIKIIKCGFKNFSKMVALPLINGIVMVSSIFALKIYTNTTGILTLFLLVGAGIFIYLGIAYLFDKHLNYKMQLLIKESLCSFRRS